MANLLWHSNTKPKILNEIPFSTKSEFEKIVFDSREILTDIIPLGFSELLELDGRVRNLFEFMQ